MEHIGGMFAPKPKKKVKHRSQRDELIDYFCTRVNADRDGVKYKKLLPSYFGYKLAHIKVRDLLYLKSICEDAEHRGGSWSKTFWWSIKPQDEKQN